MQQLRIVVVRVITSEPGSNKEDGKEETGKQANSLKKKTVAE